ncbi:hypothetical protein F7725_006281 [Dissostichus mawsoni]|uniref:Hexosyltransferase n=1 Tax=Dissostichus mawsoni TaxID=36200 RepID=A0A7J5YTV4_DISMA|nr:hypothetical protein F7725_006281 [Dissostichus mawsoni]
MVIMDWLATRCPEAAYAMKVDSDMFLNIDNLVMMLQKPDIPKLNYLTGMLMRNRPVNPLKELQVVRPCGDVPGAFIPHLHSGHGYVFSNDLPEKIVEASKSIHYFTIEDAYVGACMKKLGLSPQSPPNPSKFKAYNTKFNRCEYSKIITYILGSPKQLVDYWKDLKRPEPPFVGATLWTEVEQLKRPWLNLLLFCLLLFCLVLLVFCSSNSLSWWDSFPLKDRYQRFINPVHRPPLYRDRSKDRVQLNETTEQTTLPPTVPPKALQFHRAYPRNYHFVMDNKEVCKTKTPFLVLMVPVAPKNVAARDAIRQTWGNSSEV